MKALFLGGTGLISSAASRLAIQRGWELTLVNRGKRSNFLPAEAKLIECDINDDARLKALLVGKSYDVVVQWIGFLPERVEKDVELLLGRTGQ